MLHRQRNQRQARLALPAASRITTVQELVSRMAALARLLHAALPLAWAEEGRRGPLHREWARYAAATDPALGIDGFFDLYTQAICYGLFAARCRHRTGERFLPQQAAYHLAQNPGVLRETFRQFTGAALQDEAYLAMVDSLADLLDRTEMATISRALSRSGSDTAVLHRFATAFCAAYAPSNREGAALPAPVISYLVRSVDALLRQHFALEDGLASSGRRLALETPTPGILHLDPHAGADALLREVFAQEVPSSGYTCLHLAPCRQGFSLRHIPGVVAQHALGLCPPPGRRQPAIRHWRVRHTPAPIPMAPSAGAAEANEPLVVFLGTSPVVSAAAQHAEAALQLLLGPAADAPRASAYPTACPADALPGRLRDDQLQGIEHACWLFADGRAGIFTCVSSHAFLEHPSHSALRQRLLQVFDDLYLLATQERETVISLFIKRPAHRDNIAQVQYAELQGQADDQRAWLHLHAQQTTTWAAVTPEAPRYRLTL